MILLVVWAALTAAPVALSSRSQAQHTASADQGIQDSLAAASRIVALVYSDATQLEAADGLISKHYEPAIRRNAEFQRLERLHPGFIGALIAELRAQNRANAKRLLPAFREDVARLYANHLSAAELNDLANFYMSPTGRKMLGGMADHADASSVIRERRDNGGVSAQAVAADQRRAAAAVVEGLEPGDFSAILALRDKPYFSRLMALRGPVADVHRRQAAKSPAALTIRADLILAKMRKRGAVQER